MAEQAKEIDGAMTNNETLGKVNDALSPGMNAHLCGCCSDILGCILSCCCPCFPMAATRALVDEREVQWCDFLCCPNPYTTRQSLRKKYGAEFSPTSDCVSAMCCNCCFVSQNVREIAIRSNKEPEYLKLPN